MNTPKSRNTINAVASSSKCSSPPGPSTPVPTVNMDSMLSSLNPAQRQAVTHNPSIPLQILAGPGSGKTKVLISRIARLIITHKLEPSSICAVTFTNKAANEMRERLTKLIGKTSTTALQMGTFHSICARFLRKYATTVGLDSNFTICDADDSKKLINELLKPYKDYIVDNNIVMPDGSALSAISKAKAKGKSAAMFLEESEEADKLERRSQRHDQPPGKTARRILAEVYIGYETVLKQNNALDFDDLLIYGVKLFKNHPNATLWCHHILVDEFQDTNTMQYELMSAIAVRKCVTIVGDPDQSIYGWRSAEVVNLSRMRKDFSPVEQIFLETNYRSTSSILRSCLAIVAEDKKRIPKSLNTTHPLGATPFVGAFESEKDEAAFLAFEIKRCVANMGGVLKWGDFVVLLRFNALSRPIEAALQKEGIPCRILGGHKFFERMEVKDILSYLQLVDNPSFNPAFVRAVKVPARGMGDKTLAEIASLATKLEIPQLSVIERIHDNKIPDMKPSIKRKIAPFIKVIRTLRKLDEQNTPPSEMIRKLLGLIEYEEHLRKTQQDWESRWENVQELITFASESEAENPAHDQPVPGLGPGPSPTDDDLAGEEPVESGKEDSKLRQFLQASMLSSEGDNQSEEESKEKVTLSTCHAAKGLEWPVVMIPSVDQDTFPFYRTEDVDEERRLLYVACTRAQSLLYIMHSLKRQVAGKTQAKTLSTFVSTPREKNEGLFSFDVPRFLPEDRAVVSKVLDRPLPSEEEVERRLEELDMNGDRVQPVFQNAAGGFSAVNLAGVKSGPQANSDGLAPLYASSEALAALSASFRKDYRARPFSGGSGTGAGRSMGLNMGMNTGMGTRPTGAAPVQSIGRSLAQEGSFNPMFVPASSAAVRSHSHSHNNSNRATVTTSTPSAFAFASAPLSSSAGASSSARLSSSSSSSLPVDIDLTGPSLSAPASAAGALPKVTSSRNTPASGSLNRSNASSNSRPGSGSGSGSGQTSLPASFFNSQRTLDAQSKLSSSSSLSSKKQANTSQTSGTPQQWRPISGFDSAGSSAARPIVLQDTTTDIVNQPIPSVAIQSKASKFSSAAATGVARVASAPVPLSSLQPQPRAGPGVRGTLPVPSVPDPVATSSGTKRRLGMCARGTTGYTNKKFKRPT